MYVIVPSALIATVPYNAEAVVIDKEWPSGSVSFSKGFIIRGISSSVTAESGLATGARLAHPLFVGSTCLKSSYSEPDISSLGSG